MKEETIEDFIKSSLAKEISEVHQYMPYCKFFVHFELYNLIPISRFIHKLIKRKKMERQPT